MGPRPALALHCILGRSGAWAGVGAELDDLVTLTAPDLPGHGAAPRWRAGGDVLAASLDLCLQMFDRPLHLVGHSFGGVLALRLAMERPENAISLTLIDPVLFALIRDHPPFGTQRREVARLDRLLAAGETEAAARSFLATWGAGAGWDDMSSAYRAYILERMDIVPDQWPGLYGDSTGILEPGRLENLKVPVLLVEGGDSPPAIRAIMDELARRLPDIRRGKVPNAGHMLPVSHPEEVARPIRDHILRCG